jgi:hypothetical protein
MTRKELKETPPSTGHIGYYWTLRTAASLDDVRQIRLWTGYSWLEMGSEEHINPNECRVISDELEPPDYDDEEVAQ